MRRPRLLATTAALAAAAAATATVVVTSTGSTTVAVDVVKCVTDNNRIPAPGYGGLVLDPGATADCIA